MNYNFVKIMEFIETSVKSCKCYVEYGFLPKDNVISVRVFKNDNLSEFNENHEYSDYKMESKLLFEKMSNECKKFIKDLGYVIPSDFEKLGAGGFEYREIIIIPNE